MDLAEVAVGPPVMGGETDVAVPDGGVLKVPDALGKRLAVRPLINTDTQIQRGDLDLAEGTVFVVELARHLREQHGGLIAAIHRAAGCDNAGGTAANDRTGCGNTTGGKVGRQVFAGMEGVHALRAENRRNERGIFAHIGVFHGTAICRVDDLNRCIPAKVKVLRRGNAVFQRRGTGRKGCHHTDGKCESQNLFHSVSSSSAFSFLCFTISAPPTPAPAAATIPMGMST